MTEKANEERIRRLSKPFVQVRGFCSGMTTALDTLGKENKKLTRELGKLAKAIEKANRRKANEQL